VDQLFNTYRLLGEVCLGEGDLTAARKWLQKIDDKLASEHGSTANCPQI
jgi:hypothetical protein